jgi:hypothetical protein
LSRRRITTHTTRYASWCEGDDEREKLATATDQHDCEPDPDDITDGLTAVDVAVRTLRDQLFCTSPSTWPHCTPGATWYAEPDPYEHPHTGELTEVTAHLDGFTVQEERDIYTRVTAKN